MDDKFDNTFPQTSLLNSFLQVVKRTTQILKITNEIPGS